MGNTGDLPEHITHHTSHIIQQYWHLKNVLKIIVLLLDLFYFKFEKKLLKKAKTSQEAKVSDASVFFMKKKVIIITLRDRKDK